MPSLVTSKVRHKAQRIALYNHKGGVGKTTLLLNIAVTLADAGKRVLLVDADPQCNLTSYIVDSETLDIWLDTSDTETGVTIWSALRPFTHNTGDVQAVIPIERQRNLYLIPGDIKLSEFEQSLSLIWLECIQRQIRGFKGASAISEIVDKTARQNKIDYVFYDVGPNIGALNRVVLLDCDYFIVPAACDLFSVRGLKTLGQSLKSWILEWEIISRLAPNSANLLPGRPKFLGYILQQFRIYGGHITSQFASYAASLEKAAYSDIVDVLRQIDKGLAKNSISQNKLGQVKNFSGLVPQSQEQGLAFFDVQGGNENLKNEARREFVNIANRILNSVNDEQQ